METIDRQSIRIITNRIMAAVAPLQKDLGVKLTQGHGKYGGFGSLTIEIAAVSKHGKVITREAEDFTEFAGDFGLKASDLGKTFKNFDGDEFKIVGLRIRAPKRPILAESVDGRRFIFSVESVKRGLAA